MKNRLQGLLVILLGGYGLKVLYGYYQAFLSGEEVTIYLPRILMIVVEKLGIEQGLMAIAVVPVILILYGLSRLLFNTKG